MKQRHLSACSSASWSSLLPHHSWSELVLDICGACLVILDVFRFLKALLFAAGQIPAPAKALRTALKEAAGKLLGQLYDRNCRRQFVPPEAFQTDSLPLQRFQVEMEAAAAAAGGLMQATKTRIWGLLR